MKGFLGASVVVLVGGVLGVGAAALVGSADAAEAVPFLAPITYHARVRLVTVDRSSEKVILDALRVVHARGTTVEARCLNCTPARERKYRPVGALLGRAYPVDVRIAIALTRAGAVGRYLVIEHLYRSRPSATRSCLPPGSLRPTPCEFLRHLYSTTSVGSTGGQTGTTPATFLLSTEVAGTGAGDVIASGFSCSSTCSHSYPAGATVSLQAQPASGSTFAGWGGACGGAGSCTVTLTGDRSVSATFSAPQAGPTFTETVGGDTATWTNYANAGGAEGATIPAYTPVQISCRVVGQAVSDGDTWWYQVASSPWNSDYYASADAFYNNGQTSGSLVGTPPFDPNVPVCSG